LFETHAIVAVVDRPRLHVSVQAGGGVASLRATVHVHEDAFEIPELPFFSLPAQDTTVSRTDSGLSLEAGGTLEYMLSARVGVGATARYGHAFTDRALDYVRTTGRVTVRF